jgi:hypothetical protein
MGECSNCGKQIKMTSGEINCPKCHQVAYRCWSCHEPISADNECSACGFFICQSCGVCGRFGCPINNYSIRINSEIPTIDKEVIRKVLKKYFDLKSNAENNRYICPCGVPISYAQGRLRNFVLKMTGVTAKNEDDSKLFKERLNVITNKIVGEKFTISKIKENGAYGQEFRDTAYFLVCQGFLKINFRELKTKKGKLIRYYEEFERIDGKPCQNEQSKTIINPDKKSFVHFCQLNRHKFIKKKGLIDGYS